MEDRFGQALSTRNQTARDAYVRGVDLMLTARPGAEPCFAAAVATDPSFALGHIARARALQPQGRVHEMAGACDAARALAVNADDRERSHIAILTSFLRGDSAIALDALRKHMQSYTRDGFVLSLALGVYGLLGFSGDADHHRQQCDWLDALAPNWGQDWWFLGYRGWAHTENGNPTLGAPLLDASLHQHWNNANAAHGRAHAFYELGLAGEGEAFLDGWLPTYEEAGSLFPHLSWHLALFALRNGRTEKAADLFDQRFRPSLGKQPPFFTIVDTAAFNWRCLLRNVPRGDGDICEVVDFARQHFPKAAGGFANVHLAYAYAAAGDIEALKTHVVACEQFAREGVHPSAPVVHLICKGILNHALGRYDEAMRDLEKALPDLARIGGSHAQRDGVIETLVHACLRAGAEPQAAKLLRSRLGLAAIWSSAAA